MGLVQAADLLDETLTELADAQANAQARQAAE
jgi:hypothetical protein